MAFQLMLAASLCCIQLLQCRPLDNINLQNEQKFTAFATKNGFLQTKGKLPIPCGDLIKTSNRIKRYTLQGNKWPHLNLTWNVVQPSTNFDLQTTKLDLTHAFKMWSDVSQLTFQEVSQDEEADISISFVRGDHGDAYPFEILSAHVHAFYPGPGVGGDIHFNDASWDKENSTDVTLFAAAAHEIGHSLGLSHTNDQSALMYPYYKQLDKDFVLPEDDKLGIQALYGVK